MNVAEREPSLQFDREELAVIKTLEEARKSLSDFAVALEVKEWSKVARLIGWNSLFFFDPRRFALEAGKYGVSEFYTPPIAGFISDLPTAEKAGVIPKEADAGKIDFDRELLDRYKNRTTREDAIGEMMEKIDEYCQMVYNHFVPSSEKRWEQLLPDEKRVLMKQAVAVITDGSRILGIGYQGEKGRMISAGKLKCYFVGSDGAVMPQLSFPFGVNFGTKEDREFLINKVDPRGKYSDYELYMHLVLKAFDRLGVGLVQFEDFEGEEAWKLLKWARKNLENSWVFNDDIEGTAAMIAEALMKIDDEDVNLEDSLILFPGAGGAASGIFREGWWLIEDKLRGSDADEKSIKKLKRKLEKARGRIFFFDSAGLLYEGRTVKQQRGENEFSKFQEKGRMILKKKKMIDVLKEKLGLNFGEKVTVEDILEWFGNKLGPKGSVIFLATTTKAGTVSEEAVRKAREIMKVKGRQEADIDLFGLSNPTKFTDFLTAEEAKSYEETGDERILAKALVRLYQAASGKIRFATGSPFPTVAIDKEGQAYLVKNGQRETIEGTRVDPDGEEHMIEPAQSNNLLLFPMMYGLVMADLTPRELKKAMGSTYDSEKVWREIWQAASKALFEYYRTYDKERFNKGVLLPRAEDVVGISDRGAFTVANIIRGLAQKSLFSEAEFKALVEKRRAKVKPLRDEAEAARDFLRDGSTYLLAHKERKKRELLLNLARQGWVDVQTEATPEGLST